MSFELYLFVFLTSMFLQIIVFVLIMYALHTPQELANLFVYFKAGIFSLFSDNYQADFIVNEKKYTAAAGAMFKSVRVIVWPHIWKLNSSFLISFCAWLSCPLLLAFFNSRAARLTKPTFLRGARFATLKEVRKGVQKSGGASFGIGAEVHMATGWEQQHTLGIGRSGSGKTTLVLQQINDLRKVGAKAVIYDPKADYFSRFYDPSKGDILFNPLDVWHVRWTPLSRHVL